MSRSPRPSPKGNPFVVVVLTLVLLGGLYYLNEWSNPDETGRFQPPGESSSAGLERGPVTRERFRDFDRLNGCVLVNGRNNDGDSFLVRHGDETYELRLYYADCPEKYRHQYNGERLAEQGAYFGGLSEKETIRIGEQARDYTLDLLRESVFTVYTKWEKVYDSGRFYAFVRVRDTEGNEAYLHELLVARGLARIHTKGINLLDGTPWKAQKARLAKLEKTARAAKRGAWGL